jgi:hypothetical protein
MSSFGGRMQKETGERNFRLYETDLDNLGYDQPHWRYTRAYYYFRVVYIGGFIFGTECTLTLTSTTTHGCMSFSAFGEIMYAAARMRTQYKRAQGRRRVTEIENNKR